MALFSPAIFFKSYPLSEAQLLGPLVREMQVRWTTLFYEEVSSSLVFSRSAVTLSAELPLVFESEFSVSASRRSISFLALSTFSCVLRSWSFCQLSSLDLICSTTPATAAWDDGGWTSILASCSMTPKDRLNFPAGASGAGEAAFWALRFFLPFLPPLPAK